MRRYRRGGAALLALSVPMVFAGPARARLDDSRDQWVVAVDQAGDGRIVALDSAAPDWRAPTATTWSWAPSPANGFYDQALGWKHPSDVRVRALETGSPEQESGLALVVAASGGFVGLVSYPSGRRIWSQNVDHPTVSTEPVAPDRSPAPDQGITFDRPVVPGLPGLTGPAGPAGRAAGPRVPSANPHAAELLPGGMVAVAASRGGWVRVYAPGSAAYAQVPLRGAHGLQWDPQTRLLWALGADALIALTVNPPAAGTPAPSITRARSERLPAPGGHDLQPVYNEPGRLWIATRERVYQYVTRTGRFVATGIGTRHVKAVGDQSGTGRVLTIVPQPDCRTSWCTDTIAFALPDATRTLPGAEFYRARWWQPLYR